MQRIPFIEARFDLTDESWQEIERRLTRHLMSLRDRRDKGSTGSEAPNDFDLGDEPLEDDFPDPGFKDRKYPTEPELHRIRERSRKLVARREAASGLQHLGKREQERLSVLRDGVRLLPVETEHRADELAAALHEAMPWFGPATEEGWHALRRSAASVEPSPGLGDGAAAWCVALVTDGMAAAASRR
ncbi:hypothetical protein U879_08465 [Defluviimonas sp. 20V17]|uniref:DUF2017 domain-containing protein n=1 Tax=Allgaiera indica TaxID=765699 RepID=A0AAN5A1E1_9RHOB|nr:hypothetical protein [Allgaiera indica]KDB04118.1 hypothetical protein U879_08465 [Defluviimonas sp. 20V17]GHE06517.1 hypothetical protein GCM10008024_41070 [Allgaiera indica]SDX96948.1 hypothetical protein SAMN05444006_1564 [Allgaiera indica]